MLQFLRGLCDLSQIRCRSCWSARAVFLALCVGAAKTVAASLALAAPVLSDERAFVPIDAAAVIPAPGLIKWKVFPFLVRRGGIVTVSWEAINVASCTVTGSNGDMLTGLSGVQESGPIPAQTIFALHCPPLSGSPALAIEKSRTVIVVPDFRE